MILKTQLAGEKVLSLHSKKFHRLVYELSDPETVETNESWVNFSWKLVKSRHARVRVEISAER